MIDIYQHMTKLPEDLERALLSVPATAFLKVLKLRGISTKYGAVQKLAELLDEKALRKFVAQDHSGETETLMMAPEAAPIFNRQALPSKAQGAAKPLVKVFDETVIELTKGRTTIQPGSLRQQVLDMLQAKGGTMSLGNISAALGRDAKPVVAKLRAAGWVK